MSDFQPMKELPKGPEFNKGDVLVVFGELFGGGYVNGLIEEAENQGMQIIYSTVGRRNADGELRPLNEEELQAKQKPLINTPLEAGFDLTPSSQGVTPCDQLKGLKLKEWKTASLDWDQVKDSRAKGLTDFKARVEKWVKNVEDRLPEGKNVVFAHTMAGGVPRAKIIMPAMNRVFKGYGDRFASSEEFWQSDLGKLCDWSFLDVTAKTFDVLVQSTRELREKLENSGRTVSYTAYGYHGTEILINGEYKWQSFAPYLQGFAKMKLEDYSRSYFEDGVKCCVFNAPEILTNSSSVFSGIEIPLYTLILALEKENQRGQLQKLLDKSHSFFKEDVTIDQLKQKLNHFFSTGVIEEWSDFEGWPQHNGPEQMELIKTTSSELLEWQKDAKNPVSDFLSEVVFKACGKIMLAEASQPRKPVWWIGHEAVAKVMQEKNL